MRLAVIASGDPLDILTWSGIPYFMTKTLRAHFPDLTVIRSPFPSWWAPARRVVRNASAGRLDLAWLKTFAKHHSEKIARTLDKNKIDIAVCIACSPISAYLARRFPIIHVSDATAPLMRDYYKEFSSLPQTLANNAVEFDARSARSAQACLYPTRWAADSAIRDYEIDLDRVSVIPFGCNVEKDRIPDRAGCPAYDQCNLVFIGADWIRKGGSIVIDTFETLLSYGAPVSLEIIGSSPHDPERLNTLRKAGARIVERGFINKADSRGFALFNSILQSASFLYVPTRQDCYGLVFAEASAYGVPSISTRTGGVPGVIENGVNGYLLEPNSTIEQHAKTIWEIWSDQTRYKKLRASSRERFESVLNWDAWLRHAAPIIERAAA